MVFLAEQDNIFTLFIIFQIVLLLSVVNNVKCN